jgi:hypothetical protein
MTKSHEISGRQTRGAPAAKPDAAKPANDQGIVRDALGQEQPRDKERAQQVSRVDQGGDPPGEKPSPGSPAK